MKTFSSGEIAKLVGGELIGAPDLPIDGIASLEEAGTRKLSFLGNPKYQSQVLTSAAAAVLVPANFDKGPPPPGRAWIKCPNPSTAFSAMVLEFAPEPVMPEPGVHPDATVASTAKLGKNIHVGAQAVLEPGAEIGNNSLVEAGCYVGRDTRIGCDCRLYPHVTIRESCLIGNRVIIHCGSVIGSDGFGYEPNPEGHIKIPQTGIVQIDDDVEIGACVTVDRARFARTWIQRDVKIDNLVQIAHNVVIGEGSFIVAQTGIGGSSRLGKLVAIFGQVGIPGHLTIGDRAMLMAQALPFGDVAPGVQLMGSPAVPRGEFIKQLVSLKRIPKLQKRISELEKRLAEFESRQK